MHTGRRTLAFFSLTAKAITANGQKQLPLGKTKMIYTLWFSILKAPGGRAASRRVFFFGQKHVPDFVVHVFAIF